MGSNCGAEYCTLNFSVLPNDTTSAREGVITIFCEDYNLMATLTVVQAAGAGSDTDAWTFKGVGKFRGAGVLDFAFNIDTTVEIEVDVYEHKDNKGVYMITDPWPATIAYGFGYSSIDEALADGISTTNANFVIDASNPDAVIIPEQELGVDLGYGFMTILSGYPDYITDPAAGAGTLVDGYITFAASTMLFYSPGINVALGQNENALHYTNTQGMFRVALPGAIPFCDIEIGTAKFSEVFPDMASQYSDEEAFAYGIWGKEIANAKMLIAETSTVGEYLVQGVTLEQLVAANGEVVSSDALSQINSENGYIQGVVGLVSGTEYTLAIYAENVYGKSEFAYTTHTTDGEKPADSVKYPCEISVDLNKMSAYMPEYSSTYPDTTSLSFAVIGEEIKEAMYLFADTATFEYFLAQGATLEELVVANGYAFEEDELAAINGGGYANGFINQDPNTSYTLAIYAKNVYGESTVISDTHTTDALPQVDYTGELVTGDYYMSCVYSGTTFENLFTVTPDGESVTDFIVADIGANVGGIKWVAAYDSAAGTLTLSGIDKSRENSGNLFGKPYAYFDQEQTQALMFMSFATADSTGADPLVLKVDPWTKEITGMQNDAFIVAVVDSASGQILQYFGYYEGSATTILHESAAATRVPFSSVNINKYTVSKRLRSMKMAKLATSANSSMKPATNSVKKVSLERSKQLLSGARIDRKAFAPSRELKSVAIPFSSLKHSK
ncbi:MAG: hypothetical protein J6J57_06075 [Alistipes sp.]|nr:hypothetical protein [Alistipes sp.]